MSSFDAGSPTTAGIVKVCWHGLAGALVSNVSSGCMCAPVLPEFAPLVDMMTTHFGCGSDLFMGRNYCWNLVKLINGGAFPLGAMPVMTNASI